MKPSRRLLGLLSTTVLCLAPALGAAQDVQTPPKSKRPPSEAKSEAITVTGRGSTREVQGLSQTQLTQSFVSGTSVLKALGTLPGVSYQTSDPLGIDPWSQSFYIRGFSSAQLGFTLDDIPLGNPGYGSIGGVNLTNAISPQNVEQINVSQSAGPVDVASSDNLGGVVQAYSRDPSDKHGGELSQGFGSNSAYLTFIRLDSGALNPTGTKFYVSYYRANEGKWKGSGSMNLDQLNFKLQQPIGEASEANVFFDWDSARDDTYDDLSNEIVSKLGTRVDYLEPNFAAALRSRELRAGPAGRVPAAGLRAAVGIPSMRATTTARPWRRTISAARSSISNSPAACAGRPRSTASASRSAHTGRTRISIRPTARRSQSRTAVTTPSASA